MDDARGKDPFDPRRVLPYGRGEEGLDLTSSLKAKFGARSNQAHEIRGKALGSNVTTRRKSWYEITILGAFGVMSETKFGVFVTYILDAKFGTIAPGSNPLAPRPLIWSLSDMVCFTCTGVRNPPLMSVRDFLFANRTGDSLSGVSFNPFHHIQIVITLKVCKDAIGLGQAISSHLPLKVRKKESLRK